MDASHWKTYWAHDKTLQLIKLYQLCPTLWDREDEHFHSDTERNKCLNKIATKMKIPLPFVQLKIAALNAANKRKLHKISTPYDKYFELLNFLQVETIEEPLEVVDCILNEFHEIKSTENITEWSYEKTVTFINILENFPIMWEDFKLSPRDIQKKEIIYRKVAKRFNCNIADLKLKKRQLMSKFRSEFAYLLQHPNYKSKWKYFNMLMFLLESRSLELEKSLSQPLEEDEMKYECNDDISETTENDVLSTNSFGYENTLKLINAVRQRPEIWNEMCAGYTSAFKKDKAWTEIAAVMGENKEFLKNLFKSIYNTYKAEANLKADCPAHIISWIYFPYLEFIPSAHNIRITLESDDEQEQSKYILCEDTGNLIEVVPLAQDEDALAKVEEDIDTNIEMPIDGERDEFTVFAEAVITEMSLMSDYKQIQATFKDKVKKALKEAKEAAGY